MMIYVDYIHHLLFMMLRERGMDIPNRKGIVIEYSLADERLIQALDLLWAVMRDGLTKRAELMEALP